MAKIKAILPSLREKKRYLAFEILSKSKIKDAESVSKAIWQGMLSFGGTKGASQAGIMILSEKYNPENQRGIVKVNNKQVDTLKASLTLIQEVDAIPATVRSIGVSGSLKKATNYMAG
jgi:ribonuclease P/MRP protein subunit POP5